MSKLLFVFISFAILISSNNSLSQVEPEINFSAQADVSTAIAVRTFSINADLDFLHYKKIIPAFAGLRLSAESYYVDNLNISIDGGSVSSNKNGKGTTYTNVDLLGRFTVSGSLFEFDFCPGVYYNKSDKSDSKENGIYGKIAIDTKLKLIKNAAGLILKFAYGKQNYGGIGLYVNFSTRDK